MDDVGPIPSKAQQVAKLLTSVNDAYRLIQEAHANHEEALSIVADTELSFNNTLAVRQSGREYAAAVVRYSEAVMAWLVHLDTNHENAVKLLRKDKTAGE